LSRKGGSKRPIPTLINGTAQSSRSLKGHNERTIPNVSLEGAQIALRSLHAGDGNRRLRDAGKPARVARVAVMRKLLLQMNAVLKRHFAAEEDSEEKLEEAPLGYRNW
jgi:hypothetical protein